MTKCQSRNNRKLILVRGDLLEKVSRITAKEGKTFFAFTNEVFERAIEAHEMNVTLAEAIEFYRMLKTSKSLGSIVLPSDIFRYMSKKIYAIEPEQMLSSWYESGLWNGSYLSIKFHKRDPLEVVKSFVKASLWDLDEFVITPKNDGLDVKCFSPNLSIECIQMLEKFLEGIFNSFSYSVKRSLCLRGIITMELVRNGDDKEASALIRKRSIQIKSQQ